MDTSLSTVQPHGGIRTITTKQGNPHTSTGAPSPLKPTVGGLYTHRPHGGCHLKRHKTIISMNSVIVFPAGHRGRNSFIPLILSSGYIWNLLSFGTSEKQTLTANAKNVNMNFKVTFPSKKPRIFTSNKLLLVNSTSVRAVLSKVEVTSTIRIYLKRFTLCDRAVAGCGRGLIL